MKSSSLALINNNPSLDLVDYSPEKKAEIKRFLKEKQREKAKRHEKMIKL